MSASAQRNGWDAVRWVLLVLVVGFLVGLALSAVVTVPQGPPPSGPGAPPPPAPESSKVMLVLSTVSIALLLALLVVYGRTYRTTRAPYVLGLFVFLFVLLLESVLNSPILFSAFGVGPGTGLGRLLAFGQALMCAALALFLYLSLQ